MSENQVGILNTPRYIAWNTFNSIAASTDAQPIFKDIFTLDKTSTHMSLIDITIPKVTMIYQSLTQSNNTIDYTENVGSVGTVRLPVGNYSIVDLLKMIELLLDNQSLIINGGDKTKAYKFHLQQSDQTGTLGLIPNGNTYGPINYDSQFINIYTVAHQDGSLISAISSVPLADIRITITMNVRLSNMLGITDTLDESNMTSVVLKYINANNVNNFNYTAANIMNLQYSSFVYVICSAIESLTTVAGTTTDKLLAVIDTSATNFGFFTQLTNLHYLTFMARTPNASTNTQWAWKFLDLYNTPIYTSNVQITYRTMHYHYSTAQTL